MKLWKSFIAKSDRVEQVGYNHNWFRALKCTILFYYYFFFKRSWWFIRESPTVSAWIKKGEVKSIIDLHFTEYTKLGKLEEHQ